MHLLLAAEPIQLFPDGTIFVHIAILLGMIWLLNRTLYRPINSVLEARAKSKGNLGGEAAEILAMVEEKESRYARETLEARTKGYELIETEQRQAAEERELRLAQARAETAKRLDSERSDLDNQAAEARAEISKNAEQMAERIAATILKS